MIVRVRVRNKQRPDPSLPQFTSKNAEISACGQYRYDLIRTWDGGEKLTVFLLCNPSKADAIQPDPTLTRCVNFARSWGREGVVLINLFAYRATDPSALRTAVEPIGPRNDAVIRNWITDERTAEIILGWGAKNNALVQKRVMSVMRLLQYFQPTAPLQVLKLTKSGQPYHPLFVPGAVRPTPLPANSVLLQRIDS